MKNIQMASMLSLILFATFLLGCQESKNEDLQPLITEETLQEVNGTLKFANVEDYLNFYENKDNYSIPDFISISKAIRDSKMGLTNYRLAFEGNPVFEDLKDAAIMDLLDTDGMIIIEEYLIHLDFENQVAVVTKNHRLRKNIVEKKYEHEEIHIFSFEEDVLDILIANEEEMVKNSNETKSNLRVLTACPGSFPPGSTSPPMIDNGCEWNKCTFNTQYNEGGWSYKAEAKHVYQSAAIYFRLKSEIAHFKRNSGGSWSSEGNANMLITYWGDFTPKNRSKVYLSGCYESCQGCSPPPANKDKVQKVHHEAGRKLTSFNLYGIYEVHLGGSHAFSGYPDAFQLKNIRKS